MGDAAFWAVCFLAIGVVVLLCVGVTALSRDMNAMGRAYRTSPGRALIRAGWRVGLFERYRRWLRPPRSNLKSIGYGLHLYSTDFDEAFPSYAEGDRGDTTVGR
jgi:hypothetical protein